MVGINYCIKCGYKLDAGDNFCPNCGNKVNDDCGVIDDKDFFLKYEIRISDLKKDYDLKVNRAVTLIKKQFDPSESSYARFISTINNTNNTFYNNVEVALSILDASTEASLKIKNELDSIIDVLNNILSKMNDLIDELVIRLGDKSKKEVENLTEELDDLINSVKDY